jgi:hypothetical protein
MRLGLFVNGRVFDVFVLLSQQPAQLGNFPIQLGQIYFGDYDWGDIAQTRMYPLPLF